MDFWIRFRGLFLSVLASLLFSFSYLVVKALPKYHPVTISVWKHAAIIPPLIPVFIYFQCRQSNKISIYESVFPTDTGERKLLLLCLTLRSLSGATANLVQVWSLQYLSVGDASIFSFSAPVFVVILATVFLGESCKVVTVLVTILTLFGIGLIVRPPILTGQTALDMDNLVGVLLGCSSMFMIAVNIILLRRMRKIHWLLNLMSFALLGMLETVIIAGVMGRLELPSGVKDLILAFIALPLTVFLGQMLIILALKYESAGPVSLVGTSGVLFSFVLQLTFFGQAPDIYSAVGGTIVVVGVMITTFKKYVEELPVEDEKRMNFKIFLY